jgi:FMN phosphatase YigB (HAD superfamily)
MFDTVWTYIAGSITGFVKISSFILCVYCYNESVIKAIIFDCFGVLAEDGWTPFKRRYIEGNEEVALAVRLLGKDVDIGKRSFEDMIHETADLVGVAESVVRDAVERQVPNVELFDYIQSSLKPIYKIGMLSNASYDVMNTLFNPEQVALLDASVLSYEVGMVKPDIRMYECIAERLDVAVGECVFVDDLQRHCDGAISAGMQAVLYETTPQAKKEIEHIVNLA